MSPGGTAIRRVRPAAALLAAAVLLAGAARPAAAALSDAQIADLFSQAKEQFRQATDLAARDPARAKDLYRKAAMRFERIAREGGVRNGRLYYNTGNAYFRMGDVGRAILYYRRAQLFTPNDPNLRQNLGYARTRRTDRVEEKQEAKVLKTLFFWHYDLSARTRLVLLACVLAVLCIGASVRLFVRPAGLGWVLAISGAVAALLLGSLAAEAAFGGRDVAGVVLAPEVVARKGDGETYEPSFKAPLHAGTEFTLVEDRGDWLRVELADGRRCWLPAKAAGIVQQLTGPA